MIAHKLVSAGQLVVVQLDGGQAVWCQPGRFVWKTPNVAVQARLIGPGGQAGGLLDRALGTAITAGRRRLAGADAALPYFTVGASSGLVAFAGEPAGGVHELRLDPARGWLVTRSALVAAEGTIGLAPAAAPAATGQRPGVSAPSGLERLTGMGSAFVTGTGGLVELDLARYGGAVDVDPSRLVAVQEGVRAEARRRAPAGDELLRVLLGGGRPSLATLTGDGLVLLQSVAVHPSGKPASPDQGGSDGIPG